MMAPAHWQAAALLIGWIALAAPSAARADIVGDWTLSYSTTDGVKMESTLSIKREGDKLTGTISSPRGSVALNEVEVKGDDVMFAIVRVGFGDSIRIEYSGKMTGDTINLKIKFGARPPVDATAKRK